MKQLTPADVVVLSTHLISITEGFELHEMLEIGGSIIDMTRKLGKGEVLYAVTASIGSVCVRGSVVQRLAQEGIEQATFASFSEMRDMSKSPITIMADRRN